MNDEGGSLVIPPRAVAVYGEQGELRDELQRLAQYVFLGYVVGFGIVRIEGKDAPREHVHHIARRGFHNDIPHERGGKGAEIGKDLAESFQLALRRQMPEQKQIGRFLEIEAPALFAFDEFADVDAAVVKLPVCGDLVPVRVFSERNDLRNFRQTAYDAVAVDIAQSPLYVVFFVKFGVDDVALLRHFCHFHDVLRVFRQIGQQMVAEF